MPDGTEIADAAVSYTHLDVYKRQLLHGERHLAHALHIVVKIPQDVAQLLAA